VFVSDPGAIPATCAELPNAEIVPLAVEDGLREYPFSGKVRACAQAEGMAGDEVHSLVWMSLGCLIVNPPTLFSLDSSHDAALRPVHIRNVGSLCDEPLDPFWREIYRVLEVEESPFAVESLVDTQRLRPYFNTHCFSVNPAKKVLRSWWSHFKALASDQAFQAGACGDELHRVFLHQAVLSALFTKLSDWNRIRLLPDEYSYPLHLHQEVPQDRRPSALNDVVCAAYEQTQDLTLVDAYEPLRSWLLQRVLRTIHR
jgi:hypothetical protein